MKCQLFALCVMATVLFFTPFANAEMIGSLNWADTVEDYTANIQNFNWVLMDSSTEWWLTGGPDATSNPPAGIVNDYVGGWRGDFAGEYIIMEWNTPLVDLSGDDLIIRLFSGGKTVTNNIFANVLASDDGTNFVNIGTIGKGSSLVFRNETFDFAGQFSGGVSHVKVERVATGSGTGIFFDAFGSVPEPGSILFLLTGIGSLVMYRRRAY